MQQAKANGGSQKVGNVNVQIGDKEGIYAGSEQRNRHSPCQFIKHERKQRWKK